MIVHNRLAALLAAANASNPQALGEPLTYADWIDDAREAGADIEAAYAAADALSDVQMVALLTGFYMGFDDVAMGDVFDVATDAMGDVTSPLSHLLEVLGEYHFGD